MMMDACGTAKVNKCLLDGGVWIYIGNSGNAQDLHNIKEVVSSTLISSPKRTSA